MSLVQHCVMYGCSGLLEALEGPVCSKGCTAGNKVGTAYALPSNNFES